MHPPDAYADRVPPLAPHAAALRAFHDGREDAAIRLRSSLGEDDTLPASLFFRGPAGFFPFELYALELTRGPVLDLGAGTGVHALELQSRGHEVVAVEGSRTLVEIMRDRGVRRPVLADFRWWGGAGFETVLLLMNGLGPAGTLAGLDRLLARLRKLVSPGGQVLADSAAVSGPDRARSDAADSDAVRDDAAHSDAVHSDAGRDDVSKARPASAWPPSGGYEGQAWIDLEHAGERGRPFRELYVDLDTLRQRATAAGWGMAVAYEESGAYLARLTSS